MNGPFILRCVSNPVKPKGYFVAIGSAMAAAIQHLPKHVLYSGAPTRVRYRTYNSITVRYLVQASSVQYETLHVQVLIVCSAGAKIQLAYHHRCNRPSLHTLDVQIRLVQVQQRCQVTVVVLENHL